MFCMYHEIVPVEWETGSVRWSSAWYGQPCHEVRLEDGRMLCIHCANEKPAGAHFVFTPDWFQTFQCRWECPAGLMGPGCGVSTAAAAASAVGVLLMAGLVVARRWRRLEHVDTSLEAQPEALTSAAAKVAPRAINEAISFKEGALHEIRIKLL